MPISTLDPKTAIVVIDIQKGIVGLPTIHPMSGVIANSVALARAFRTRGLPVVLVNVAGGPSGRTDVKRGAMPRQPGWTELIPELEALAPDVRMWRPRELTARSGCS